MPVLHWVGLWSLAVAVAALPLVDWLRVGTSVAATARKAGVSAGPDVGPAKK